MSVEEECCMARGTHEIIVGDCLERLQALPAGSVHACVTSPPYFGLRDYGTGTWEGGDEGCDHVAGMARQDTDRETPGGRGGSFRGGTVQYRDICGKCGARRIDKQLGNEPTPDCGMRGMVVLRDDLTETERQEALSWLRESGLIL